MSFTTQLRGVMVLVLVGMVVAAGVGYTAGSATAGTKVQTVTETRSVTPAACFRALDYADRGFSFTADFADAMAVSLAAAAVMDSDTINEQTVTVNSITEQVQQLSPVYNEAKDECRRGGQ